MEKCCIEGSVEFNSLKELSEYLKVLSDINRLQILCLIRKGERCVCNIHEPLGLPQNLVSHHLKTLRDARLVITRRQGKWVYYRINSEKIDYITNLYNKLLSGGDHGDQGVGIGLCQLQEVGGECS